MQKMPMIMQKISIRPSFDGLFFWSSKIRKCQKDIVVNPSKTQASRKNQN